jgi:hypothetical protein
VHNQRAIRFDSTMVEDSRELIAPAQSQQFGKPLALQLRRAIGCTKVFGTQWIGGQFQATR